MYKAHAGPVFQEAPQTYTTLKFVVGSFVMDSFFLLTDYNILKDLGVNVLKIV